MLYFKCKKIQCAVSGCQRFGRQCCNRMLFKKECISVKSFYSTVRGLLWVFLMNDWTQLQRECLSAFISSIFTITICYGWMDTCFLPSKDQRRLIRKTSMVCSCSAIQQFFSTILYKLHIKYGGCVDNWFIITILSLINTKNKHIHLMVQGVSLVLP